MPLPWSGHEPPFGFSPSAACQEPWLPQPKEWRELTVEAEAGEPDSMLELYRRALRIRRAEPALSGGPAALTWLPAPDGVLAFDRGGVACVANLSPAPVDLPAHTEVLLASDPARRPPAASRHVSLAAHPAGTVASTHLPRGVAGGAAEPAPCG